MRNLYSQDGEAEILMPAMDESVQAAFMDSLTDFCKGPPLATAIHQAWDRNKSFRDCKRGMKTVTEAGTDTSNRTLEVNMRLAFRDLRRTFPEINMASAVEDKMVKAAEVISFVQKSNYTNSRKHVISYQVIELRRTALHKTQHCSALHCIHCCTALHCTALHKMLQCTTLHRTAYNNALQCKQHYTTLHCTTLHFTDEDSYLMVTGVRTACDIL